MISIHTVYNGRELHKKYYKNNTFQTRDHYILSLRQANVGNYRILDIIKMYKKDFVERCVIPYDENFYFEINEVPVYGQALADEFYVYKFYLNENINMELVYTKDKYEIRCDFIDEVSGYLKDMELYDIDKKLVKFYRDFIYEKDSAYLSVEQHKFSMRKEND